MSAVSVKVSTVSVQGTGAGSSPSTALHKIKVQPIPFTAAKRIIVEHHYLHSLPGGTMLSFGVFFEGRLLGAVVFGAGPQNAYQLVDMAKPEDCLTLTRLWLSDELGKNAESRVIAVCLRSLRRFTRVKFVVSYADPGQGHVGTIYQATGWLYTGLSEAMPLFDVGDHKLRHSRSLAQGFGSHSVKHFEGRGIAVKLIPQPAKHRYIYFLDKSYRSRLKPSVLAYPKKVSAVPDDSTETRGRVGGMGRVCDDDSSLYPNSNSTGKKR